jgi:hypothetical protein
MVIIFMVVLRSWQRAEDLARDGSSGRRAEEHEDAEEDDDEIEETPIDAAAIGALGTAERARKDTDKLVSRERRGATGEEPGSEKYKLIQNEHEL